MEPSPLKTAWSGYYMQCGSKHDVNFESVVFNTGRKITGQGSDELGDFIFDGRYDDRTIKWRKTYTTGQFVGDIPLTYAGQLQQTPEGQKITGKYYWKSEDDGDTFEMLRSKDLEKKREAAFKSVVSRVKVKVGLMRFFAEDLGMAACKVATLLYYSDMTLYQKVFTYVSLASNLLMALAGPFLEERTSRAMAQAAAGVPAPTIMQARNHKVKRRTQRSSASDGGHGRQDLDDDVYYKSFDDDDEDPEDERIYQARLEEAEKLTTLELVTGNLDYIAVLMEITHKPAEVMDVAITDLIGSRAHVRYALILSNILFWAYTVSLPLVWSVPCGQAMPSTAHLGFCMVAFLTIFVQVWCSALTKYGYLMLAYSPQMFAFDCGLSFLGLFSSYSSCAWVMNLRECDIWLWKPAAAIYIIGMILLQAVTGIYLLASTKHIPAALRLTQNNLLLALLKPAP